MKDLVFFLYVFGWEDGKLGDGKLSCLVEKKNERLKMKLV